MRTIGLVALLLVGCGPAQAVIDDGPGADDTGEDTGADTDSNDTDTGDDTDDDPGPAEPDLSAWVGKRVFDFEDVYGQGPCAEIVIEEGVNVTDDPDYEGALEACSDCEELFYVETGVVRGANEELGDRMCVEQVGQQGFPVASPVVRGIEFIGASVKVYSLRQGWGGWSAAELADGTLDGTEVRYDYEGEAWGADFTVEGTIDF